MQLSPNQTLSTASATGAADLFRHVSAEKAAVYRCIMDVFAAAKRQYRLQLRPDEVLQEALWPVGAAPRIEELNAALSQLAEWGNLQSQPDTARVATLNDFYRARFLYRLSQGGEAVESALAVFVQTLQHRAELQTVALEDIASRLLALQNLIDADTTGAGPDTAKAHEILRDLMRVVEGLAENAQAFMAGVARSIELRQAEAGSVVDYKRRLIDYLERFMGDLVRRSDTIARMVLALSTHIDPILLRIAEREARDAAPGGEQDLADERMRRWQGWRERWKGLRGWFLQHSHEPDGPPQGRIPQGAARRYSNNPDGPPQGRIPQGVARRYSNDPDGPPQGRTPQGAEQRYSSEPPGRSPGEFRSAQQAGYADTPPQAELLRARVRSAIPQLLAAIAAINERRSGRSDRSADFRMLAGWFAACENDADAHRLARAAFALQPARHFSMAAQSDDPIPPGTRWADAPPLQINPRLREYGEAAPRGPLAKLRDRSEERLRMAGELAEESRQVEAARRRLATGRTTRLSDLGELDAQAFGLFLNLLGEALAEQNGPHSVVERQTGDGLLFIRLEPLAGDTVAHVVTPAGVFSGRDHRLTISPTAEQA